MAFMGLETVREQHSFNTFCVQSNRFIDLTINSHTNPFNLASSGLLRVWAPGSKRSWTSS